ncbi:MAG: tyrosine-protein phosphatase [Lentisphaeria bacterium]|nr:tyrosine-protein phosphatase [Lentisphaeria bacterium]
MAFNKAILEEILEVINQGNVDKSKEYINQIQRILVENPELRSVLGPYIGRLKRVEKVIPFELSWCSLKAGRICIGHRPKVKEINSMKSAGVTHILTLLSEKEGALQIQKATKKAEIGWMWLPLPNAKVPDANLDHQIETVFKNCKEVFSDEGSIYIHCSAGIHRTGMITNALLRFLGYSQPEAGRMLTSMRQITHNQVGEERLNYGGKWAK